MAESIFTPTIRDIIINIRCTITNPIKLSLKNRLVAWLDLQCSKTFSQIENFPDDTVVCKKLTVKFLQFYFTKMSGRISVTDMSSTPISRSCFSLFRIWKQIFEDKNVQTQFSRKIIQLFSI